jgi:hypothetical protein
LEVAVMNPRSWSYALTRVSLVGLLVPMSAGACGGERTPDAGPDAAVIADAGASMDGWTTDGDTPDAAAVDSGVEEDAAGATDAAVPDDAADAATGADAGGSSDAGVTAEICDGADDDGDGTADEGCPESIVLEDGTFEGYRTFARPFSEASEFTDVCPPGYAFAGLAGTYDQHINRIAANCERLVLTVEPGSSPFHYRIRRVGFPSEIPVTLPIRGTTEGSRYYGVSCLPEQVVVGIEGRGSGGDTGGIHGIGVRCAELLVTRDAGGWRIDYGPITTQRVNGSYPGLEIEDEVFAPAVVDRYRGRAGEWLHAIGLGVSSVRIVLRSETSGLAE